MTEIDAESKSAAREAMLEQMRQLLGDERFATYQRSQDSSYRDLVRVAERFELTEESAIQAYELEKSFGEARRRVEADSDREKKSSADLNETREAMRAEFQKKMAALLGEEAFRIYFRMRSGKPDTSAFEP